MHINYESNAELCNHIFQNIWKIPHDIDGIICIPRGGLLVGTIISELLHKPIYTVGSFLDGKSLGSGLGMNNDNTPPKPDGTYIIVDDSSASGRSFVEAKKSLENFKGSLICVAAVCDKRMYGNADIVLQEVNEPRLMEINMWRIPFISRCIVDIDGVLCPDPAPWLDLDEPKYISHILNAPLKVRPAWTVTAICTHRLVIYAEQTKKWLDKHDIGYGVLYMPNYQSIQEKIEKMNTPEFINMKTNVYDKHKDAALFIESNWEEANRIYKNLHRPVLCTDKNILLQD